MNWKEKLYSRISELWRATAVVDIAEPMVIFSDLHLGDGGKRDKFLSNYNNYSALLNGYRDAGYTVVINGDLEDTWKFSRMEIHGRYPRIGRIHRELEEDGRFYRISGNHDPEAYPEAITFSTPAGHIFVTHGNQGDLVNDEWWWIGYLWTRFVSDKEPKILRSRLQDSEMVFIKWANTNQINVVCGHTHKQEHCGFYWNDGSQMTPGRIEWVEVTDKINLKSWSRGD